MTRVLRKTTVVDLPNEILLEVAGWLSLANKKTKYIPIGKKFNIIYVLSQVNRRFRMVLKPILCSTLQFSGHRSFDIAVRKFRNGVYNYGNLVKSIEIYKPVYTWYIDTCYAVAYPDFTLRARRLSFPNLVSFECYDGFFQPREMEALTAASAQNLRAISLIWDDCYSFVPQTQVPKLDSLRLWLQMSHDPYLDELVDTKPYTSITRLMLHNSHENGSGFIGHHLRSVEFPSLRVFNLLEPFSHGTDWIFDFVQRHPTLLEVNLQFGAPAVRFESIVKLAQGTGTWVLPPDAPQSTRKDLTTWGREDTDVVASQSPEQSLNMDGHLVYTTEFAFSRRPLSPEATQWCSAIGSSYPRYELTALAIEMEDTWMGSTDDDDDSIAYLPHFVQLLSRFPHLEELRLSTCTDQTVTVFPRFMNDLIHALSRFSRLRKVALHWPLELFNWLDTYESEDRPRVDYIDDVCPPLELPNDEISRIDTAYPEDVREGRGIENNIRSVLDLPKECNQSLGEEEEHIAVRAWRILHDQDIRMEMKALAERCPLLEEIDWYPMWKLFDSCVRWDWQVVRAEDGTISRLKDELTWPGCIRGNPPPMLMLVGEELEYVQRSGLGRWRPV